MAGSNCLISLAPQRQTLAFQHIPNVSHLYLSPYSRNNKFQGSAITSNRFSRVRLLVSRSPQSPRRAPRFCTIASISAEHANYSATLGKDAPGIPNADRSVTGIKSSVNTIIVVWQVFRNLLIAFGAVLLSFFLNCSARLSAATAYLNRDRCIAPIEIVATTGKRRSKTYFATVYPIVTTYRRISLSVPLRPALTAVISGNALPASLAHVTTHASAPSDDKPPLQKSLLGFACVMFTVAAALAAAETAITTLWPWKVRELAEKEGEKSPFSALESDLTRFLTTILVSTTSATIFSTAIATELAGEVFGTAAVGYVTAAMTVFFLFFGEILPKAVAVHAPAKVARIMVPFISTLSIIVYPVGKLLAAVSTFILRLLKLPLESDTTVSEEELRLIVAGADRSGSIEKYESQIIHNVLDLEETDVKSIMCPRVDMVAIPNENTMAQLLELEAESHYSRMPVFEGTIDNIVGIALAKSLLRYLTEDPDLLQKTKVAEVMEPAFFVPESMSVWVALEEMRKRRLHMAVVVDEYGGTAGLVTLEDILEEVVGEIYDEDDDYEAESQFIASIGDGYYTVDGQTSLEKVAQAFNLVLSEDDLDDYGTISGFLCAQMGGIPEQGEEVVVSHVRFQVTEANDRRIIRLRAKILTEEEIAQITEEERRLKESEIEGDTQDLTRNVLDVEPAPKKPKLLNSDSNGTSEKGTSQEKIEGFS